MIKIQSRINDTNSLSDKKCRLSIIVPIYNAEKYLRICLDSIVLQDFSDYELILVNDGSQDKSEEICKEYKLKYRNVHYIYKENEGIVSARIVGVSAAKGEYIGFVDADDWIDMNYFKRMMEVTERYLLDVVCSSYIEYMNGIQKKVPSQQPDGYYEGKKLNDLKNNMMYMPPYFHFGIYPSLWSKIIRKQCLISCQRKIPKNIKLGEDAAVFYSIMLKECRSIYIMNDNNGYYYRQTPDSMVHKSDTKMISNVLELMYYLNEIFIGENEAAFNQKHYYYYKLIKWCIGNEIGGDNIKNIVNNLKLFRESELVSNTFNTGLYRDAPLSSRILFHLYKNKKYYSVVWLSLLYKKLIKQ